MARSSKSLRRLLQESTKCVMAPCVYDCASARAVEMVGFPAMMLSGGEVSIAMNGVIDYGFTNLTDLEWITSRISQTSGIPLAADIEDGFGGPLAVYRAARRMAMAGAKAIQLEDAGDMEESTELLPREKYKGTDRTLPKAPNHYHRFVDACLGGEPSNSPFEVSGPMAEAIILGTVAIRVPDTLLHWDARRLRVKNSEIAQQLVRRTYRDGWAVDLKI